MTARALAASLGLLFAFSGFVFAQLPATLPAIDANAVLQHAMTLSSDRFEGRAPGTKGEELTVTYIADQFRKFGLKPGAPADSYFQNVPLVGITPDPATAMTVTKDGAQALRLAFKDDIVAWTKRSVPTVELGNSEMVFVGYGVQAPEFSWDDYKGLDVRGKTLVMLVGDPPVADRANPAELDPKMFGGKAMTYYGRWTYKFEIAQKLGAAAALIVHETGPAGYPFSVVQVKTGEQFDIAQPDGNMTRPAIEGWIRLEQVRKLFALAGRDFDALKKQAATLEFKPVSLGLNASMRLVNKIRTLASRNVIGRVEGSDPALKHEYVLYTAHWDHFGIGAPLNGDPVYHGALDNAVAVGGLLELARTFAALPTAPKRSILFLAVTSEEQLMLGSEYYATHPIYPLEKTLAEINLEMLNVHGKTRDLTVIGLGASDLDDYARVAAAEQGRVLKPDPEPERGMYYRSDHFSLARQGVPAFEPDHGDDYIGKPAGYGLEVRKDFFANLYHKPTDTVKPDWDLSGGAQDLQLFGTIGYRVAQADTYPQWKPGAEFKAKRDAAVRKK
ncbi:MAG TPA: M28 family peptidase [Vicinamibacterales bacterium]|jgi:Zn-dependent M28 family amino/carboxypeptidase